LWGKDLYQHLASVYGELSKYCVVFVSNHYLRKLWTKHELKQAQARSFALDREYILPVRLDDTVLPGLPATVGYVDLRSTAPPQIALILLDKLGIPAPALRDEVQRAAWNGVAVARPTFEGLGREWQAKRQMKKLSESAHRKDRQLLEGYAYPALGSKRVDHVTPSEVLVLLQEVAGAGKSETAARLRATVSRVFRYGVMTGQCERDPTADIRGAVPTHRTAPHPALFEPKAIGALVRAIEGYCGSPITRAALAVLLRTYVRPGELRNATWAEVNLEAKLWTICASRMKMRREHIVPLSDQVCAELAKLREGKDGNSFVFPAVAGGDGPISDGTLNAALRRLGYSKDEVVGHGFRRTAWTILNESGQFSAAAIEMSLAHIPQRVQRAPGMFRDLQGGTATQALPERVKMAQWYSDWLDRAAAGVLT
jgi:integrase